MIKTLLKSLREYKKQAILTPVFVCLEVMMECLLPFVMASLIDHMGTGLSDVMRYGGYLIAMAILSLIFGVLSGRAGATAGAGFAKNLRQDLFFKVQEFSFSDIDQFSTSSLITRLTTDVSNVQNAFQMITRMAMRAPLMLIFSVVMSVSISLRMAMIFFAMIPILALVIFILLKTTVPIFKRIFKKYDALNNSIQENVSGIRVVKAFVREDYEIEKFGKAAGEVRNDFTRAEKRMSLVNPLMMFCVYMAMLLISFIGARLIITSHGSALTTGEMTSLITYGIQILMSMMIFGMAFIMVTMAQESANRIVEVLSWEPSLASPENGIKEVADGSVVFKDVSFKYKKEGKNEALKDVDLEIPSGSTVGILGGTGSSKTTLVQLISRLYDVTEGSVYVGGHDVREYDLTSLRDQVAMVLQKNVLFSGTIKENLRWGKKDATEEELRRVCRLAQADEFIEQMPDRYDTRIDQGGANVSGGQKQRLCIARALLKNPKVLILDDSTSAVDTKTDAMIRRALAEEMPDTTKLIIAQRVSSVQDADMILVMEDGRIAEQGTHEELMALNGIYREVYDSQNSGREAA